MRSEYFGQHFRKRQSIIAIFLLATILTVTGLPTTSHAAAKNYSSATYKLEHISVDKASRQLVALGLSADIKKFEKSGTLVVTTDSIANKVKVASVLGLIDSVLEYEVTKLSSGTDTKNAPSTALINAAIRGIEVGSFTKPPVADKSPKAIIDIHGQNLISIAPKGLSRPIIAKLSALQTAQKIRGEALQKEQEAAQEKAAKLKAEAEKIARDKAAQELKAKIEKAAKEKEAKASITSAAKTEAILKLTDTNRTSITKGKTSSKPPIADKSIGIDLSTLSPTMRQFKEAQKQLAEALKNAKADSVNKFMKNKKNAKQISQLAKDDNIDSGLLKLIKESQEKAKEKTTTTAVKAKTTKTTKAEPQKTVPVKAVPAKTNPVVKRHGTGATPSNKKPVAPAKEKTTPKTPAVKVTPKRITTKSKTIAPKTVKPKTVKPKTVKPANVTPKTVKPKTAALTTVASKNQPPKKDNMADILKMIQAMNAGKPKTTASKKPVNTTVRTGVKPNIVKPANVAQPKPVATTPEVKKTTGSTKFPTELSEKELDMTINLPTKVPITKLLELVGMELGLNYMYDPAQVTGEVTLFIHDGGKIKVRELYSLVESVLKFKGFVMTRNGSSNLVTVVKQGQAMEIDTDIFGENETVDGIGNVIVTKIFKVKHVDTSTAQQMLADMKLGISIQAIPEYGTMIITGYAYRMNRIQEVIELVDLPGKKKEFRYRMLTYLTPSELAPKIQTLAQELGTVSISVSSKTAAITPQSSPRVDTSKMSTAQKRAYLIKESQRKRDAAKRTSSSKTSSSTIGAATSKSVYLDIDDRTNRILMIGLTESIDVVEDLIDVLDVKQQGIMVIRQYKIEFVDASMVIDILSELGITAGGARPSKTTPPTTRGRTTTPTTTRGATSGDGPKISLLMDTNSLLVNATLEKHEEIMAIIAHVDLLNPDERTIKEYEIEHVDTQEILDTLTELGITSAQSSKSSNSRYSSQQTSRTSNRTSTSSSKTSTARPTQAVSNAFSEPLADEPQIAILESTNSLLINATAKQHASIGMVIKHVDREVTENSNPYVIYPLENQEPENLKTKLDMLVNETSTAKASSKTSGSGTTPSKIVNTQKSSSLLDAKDKVTIVADDETRSLVVFANKKNQLWLGNIIRELDRYRPQVLLDVTLVEITQDDSFNFDLDLATQMDGYAKDFGATIASGFGSAFFSDKQVSAVLDSMDTKQYGRVLARPSILVKDNQEGEIKTETKKYIADIKSNVVTSTNGDPYSTSTVNFTGYTEGITLTITPHIASEKLLQLELLLDRTDFANEGNEVLVDDNTVTVPPDELSSTIGTTAVLPDGATIILGGIEQADQNKTVKKVPILGDIPLVGFLFRGTSDKDVQSKLYIFVKANIIRPGDELTGHSDIELISREKREKFRKDEAHFQNLESIPGFKPKPMEPIEILEDDEYLKALKSDEPKYIEIEL